jgi:hypothetical protein
MLIVVFKTAGAKSCNRTEVSHLFDGVHGFHAGFLAVHRLKPMHVCFARSFQPDWRFASNVHVQPPTLDSKRKRSYSGSRVMAARL